MSYTPVVQIDGGGTGQITKQAAMDALSPGWTKGDLIVHSNGHNDRLASGATGQVLVADTSSIYGMAWQPQSSLTPQFAGGTEIPAYAGDDRLHVYDTSTGLYHYMDLQHVVNVEQVSDVVTLSAGEASISLDTNGVPTVGTDRYLLRLRNNGSTVVGWDTTDGTVWSAGGFKGAGISPAASVNIGNYFGMTPTHSTGTRYGLWCAANHRGSGGSLNGGYFQCDATTLMTGAASTITGGSFLASQSNATYTANTIRAAYTQASMVSAGGATNVYGNQVVLVTAGSGNISTAAGIYLAPPGAAGGTVNAAHGIYIRDYCNLGATATNAIRISAQTGASALAGNINMNGGDWDDGHLQLGAAHIWHDSTGGELYAKNGTPASNTDGTRLTGYIPLCLSSYIDVKERQTYQSHHGELAALSTGDPLNSTPTDITVTNGIGKLVISVNAGSDTSGTITVTGTSINRETGAETPADTSTITVSGVTTDSSDTDADGNTRWSLTNAYITDKWFKGSVTLSTTNLTLTDVDTYQVAFEQGNDNPSIRIDTLDFSGYANNASASFYAYLYSLQVSGDTCAITREASLELPSADVTADRFYRLRRGNIATTLDGTSDGFWIEAFPAPLVQAYWEDMNMKLWLALQKVD